MKALWEDMESFEQFSFLYRRFKVEIQIRPGERFTREKICINLKDSFTSLLFNVKRLTKAAKKILVRYVIECATNEQSE